MGLWKYENRSDESRFILFQSARCFSVRFSVFCSFLLFLHWSTVENGTGRKSSWLMHSSCVCYTSLWSQCYNLGLLQLVRFNFGNIMCAKKNQVSWLPECAEWPGFSISRSFFYRDGTDIFQNDRAKIHLAQIVKEWFRENESSFSHMVWPQQSPDINPIENLWDTLEKSPTFSLWMQDVVKKCIVALERSFWLDSVANAGTPSTAGFWLNWKEYNITRHGIRLFTLLLKGTAL